METFLFLQYSKKKGASIADTPFFNLILKQFYVKTSVNKIHYQPGVCSKEGSASKVLSLSGYKNL